MERTSMGSSDCERIGDGLLSQPVNAISSLAFVPAGWIVARRRPDRRELAGAIALVGVGSVLAHGPRTRGSEWLHDVTIAWVLAAIGLDDAPPGLRRAVYTALGVLFAVSPRWGSGVSGLAAVAVIAPQARRRRARPATRRALRLAAVGALIGNATRTGSPLCDPDARLQGHAAWHVLAAAALAVWGAEPTSGNPARSES